MTDVMQRFLGGFSQAQGVSPKHIIVEYTDGSTFQLEGLSLQTLLIELVMNNAMVERFFQVQAQAEAEAKTTAKPAIPSELFREKLEQSNILRGILNDSKAKETKTTEKDDDETES